MSREIKFRVWFPHGITGEINPHIVDIHKEGNAIGGVIDDRIIVEQYTGLKDENGKEIYEGDIVTLEYDLENIEPEDCSVITFSNGCFRVGDGYENEAGSYLSDWQVIGNIHENPELLGGEE